MLLILVSRLQQKRLLSLPAFVSAGQIFPSFVVFPVPTYVETKGFLVGGGFEISSLGVRAIA